MCPLLAGLGHVEMLGPAGIGLVVLFNLIWRLLTLHSEMTSTQVPQIA